MEIKEIPFNQTMLKKAAGEDEIEYYNINQRDENGGRTLELKITDGEGRRKVVVLADAGRQRFLHRSKGGRVKAFQRQGRTQQGDMAFI